MNIKVRPPLRQLTEALGPAVAPDGRVAARLGAVTAMADIWDVESQQGTLEIVVFMLAVAC